MAPKKPKSPRNQQSSKPSVPQSVRQFAIALSLLALAALASPVSQLSLAPVYGSIPSSLNHKEALACSFLVAYLAKFLLGTNGRTGLRYLPLWAAVVPVLQYLLFQYSDALGLVAGPILTGLLSCHMVVVPTVYVAATYLELCIPNKYTNRSLVLAIGGFTAFALFTFLERTFSGLLPDLMTLWPHLNPFNLQVVIALSLTLTLPQGSTLFLTTVLLTNLLALVAPYGSGPYSTALLQASLDPQDWTLLARQWSNTGYLSVLQNNKANYRVLRCDHSLLGGEWQLTPQRKKEGWKVTESIYAVFQMLEAVRLLEQPEAIPDSEAEALVIGLGIGTAPKAFLAHGIQTTIVELDPKVHEFATKYFALPTNHTAVLSNAITWVSQQVPAHGQKPSKQYDYILHDVFTGGAEPLPLFTTSFLRNLRSLLKPNGVAALNYAGDLSLPLTARILNTIDRAFDNQCAIYRDAPVADNPSNHPDEEKEDFSNFVVFCRNTPGPMIFRRPMLRDFLESHSRKSYLYPRPDHEVQFPLRGTEREAEVLEDANVGKWRKQQEESARRHWRIMRTVVPARVWELY